VAGKGDCSTALSRVRHPIWRLAERLFSSSLLRKDLGSAIRLRKKTGTKRGC
jgi:hypothetical protein